MAGSPRRAPSPEKEAPSSFDLDTFVPSDQMKSAFAKVLQLDESEKTKIRQARGLFLQKHGTKPWVLLVQEQCKQEKITLTQQRLLLDRKGWGEASWYDMILKKVGLPRAEWEKVEEDLESDLDTGGLPSEASSFASDLDSASFRSTAEDSEVDSGDDNEEHEEMSLGAHLTRKTSFLSSNSPRTCPGPRRRTPTRSFGGCSRTK